MKLNSGSTAEFYNSADDLNNSGIGPNSTAVLTFDCAGTLESRTDYTLNDAQNLVGFQHIYPRFGFRIANSSGDGVTGFNVGSHTKEISTLSSDTIYVTKDIHVTNKKPLVFEDKVLIFSPGTGIIVNPEGSLKIRNSTLYSQRHTTWKGIKVIGNYHPVEQLVIDSSIIANALTPVTTDKLPFVNISNSRFMNGTTAIQLDRNQQFMITNNEIMNFETGIKTYRTLGDFNSLISENTFRDVGVAAEFYSDKHTQLDITCNSFAYYRYGILSHSTELNDQGDNFQGAGNSFHSFSNQPFHYLNHNGSPTKYHYDPSASGNFSSPDIMSIDKLQAQADNTCTQAQSTPFGCIDLNVGIEDNIKNVGTGKIVLYPNPSSGLFTVNLEKIGDRNSSMEIYNMMGKLVKVESLIGQQQEIDLSGESKGVYLVRIVKGHDIHTVKVIVE